MMIAVQHGERENVHKHATTSGAFSKHAHSETPELLRDDVLQRCDLDTPHCIPCYLGDRIGEATQTNSSSGQHESVSLFMNRCSSPPSCPQCSI